MSSLQIVATVARELSLAPQQVASTLSLFDEGNTLPFIARYRKEATGGLDEEQLRDVRVRAQYITELDDRRVTILKSIQDQGKLDDVLRSAIDAEKGVPDVAGALAGARDILAERIAEDAVLRWRVRDATRRLGTSLSTGLTGQDH